MDRLTAERYGIHTPADWQALCDERVARGPAPQPPVGWRWLPSELCAPMTATDRANGQRLLANVERASRGRARELRGGR